MNILHIIKDLLLPPRCAACRKLLAPSVKKRTPLLCPSCRGEWELALARECPDCHAAYSHCRCMPRVMQRAGIAAYVKLVPYGDGMHTGITRKIITNIKERGAKPAFTFLAGELKDRVNAAVAAADLAKEKAGSAPLKTVVAHLPRSAEAVRRYGFDQAKELSAALMRCTGLRYTRLLVRSRDGVAQKGLNATERKENIRGAFRLRRQPIGLRVILVDDIVTTGTGMAEAAHMLLKAGAAEVFAVSVAYTEKK